MKTTTDKLFKLIKAMSPAEKRYFKRHYGSESNTLTHLYDAINLQKEYDEESIKGQFPGKVAMNLKVYKFQLEQLLLKSLASHRHGANVGSKIRMGLEHFEILLEKNLLQMATKQLHKTKQNCLKHEKYAYLPVILAKETKLQQIQADNYSSEIPQVHQEVVNYSEKILVQYQQYSKLNALIDLYYKSNLPISKSALKNFLQDLAIVSPKFLSDAPIDDQVIPGIIKGIQHLLIGEFQTADQILAKVIQYFQKNASKASHFAYFYLNCLHGAIDANFQLKNLEQVKEYLKAAQKFCEKNPLHLPQVLRFAHYEIQLSIQNNASEAFLSKQLPKYEATIETLNLHDQLNTQLFYGWSALAALFTGQELVSENLVEKMRESPEDKAAYLLAFSRILEFVIYFETPNFQKINQFLGRSKKEKKIKLPEADKVFFDCFLRFVDELATDPRSAQVMAQQFLEKIGQIPPGGHLIQLFKTFKLDDWLRAIVKESAFIEELSIA